MINWKVYNIFFNNFFNVVSLVVINKRILPQKFDGLLRNLMIFLSFLFVFSIRDFRDLFKWNRESINDSSFVLLWTGKKNFACFDRNGKFVTFVSSLCLIGGGVVKNVSTLLQGYDYGPGKESDAEQLHCFLHHPGHCCYCSLRSFNQIFIKRERLIFPSRRYCDTPDVCYAAQYHRGYHGVVIRFE